MRGLAALLLLLVAPSSALRPTISRCRPSRLRSGGITLGLVDDLIARASQPVVVVERADVYSPTFGGWVTQIKGVTVTQGGVELGIVIVIMLAYGRWQRERRGWLPRDDAPPAKEADAEREAKEAAPPEVTGEGVPPKSVTAQVGRLIGDALFLLWSAALQLAGLAATLGVLANLLGYGYALSPERGFEVGTLDELRQARTQREFVREFERSGIAVPVPTETAPPTPGQRL